MEINQIHPARTQKLVILLLVLLLAGLVAAYIYYGMQFAQQTNDPEAAVETSTEIAPEAELTKEERMQILATLSTPSSSTPSTEERKAILDSLGTSGGENSLTLEERQAILGSL